MRETSDDRQGPQMLYCLMILDTENYLIWTQVHGFYYSETAHCLKRKQVFDVSLTLILNPGSTTYKLWNLREVACAFAYIE